ncbi:hypothetical protein [Roseovarius sp. MMSF_3281]|uniref:hypothetical protein n=1 Tax=Roseovarius sp. MMSF_3281 TaxID=3046694 RepID=UPI00273F5F99|nr:hypothetical protein [Roseovarius sp. MMSF_3281]
MTEQLHGTVAVLELKPFLSQTFEDIVEEIDLSFRPPGLMRQALIRDGDDIAILERGPVRLVLGWIDQPSPNRAPHLILAIGRTEDSSAVILDEKLFRLIKAQLLMHAESYLPINSILHSKADRPVGTELIDSLCELLHYTGYPHAQTYNPSDDTAADHADAQDTQDDTPENAQPNSKIHPKSSDILDADYQPLAGLGEDTLPQKLTVYTVGATMMMVSPPVGATFIVYACLRAITAPKPQQAFQ